MRRCTWRRRSELGAGNVKLAYARWAGLPDLPFRVLAYMAVVSKDEDPKPCFWGGWESLALAAGRLVPDRSDDPAVTKARRAALKAVNAAVKVLVDRGAVRVKVVAAPGRNATYELNFVNRTVHADREPSQDIDQSNGARLPATTVHAQPTNGARSASQTVHAQRAPEDYEEEVRTKPKEEITGVDLTVTPTREPADAKHRTDDKPNLRLVQGGGNGWCLACYAAGSYVVAVDEGSGDACKAHIRVIDGRAS
jgi:hypothetical protein